MEDDNNNNTSIIALIEWEEKDELKREVLQYLDVLSLVEKKAINKNWMKLCNDIINEKSKNRQAFATSDELCYAVRKYIEYNCKKSEELTKWYGWPIGSWDVSGLDDLSFIFHCVHSFNENISSWDVSNAKSMCFMFFAASSFNQDISSWDVSSTTDMTHMFNGASAFNQDISTWDVSNANNMIRMFYNALSFQYKDTIMSAWDLIRENLSTFKMFDSDDDDDDKKNDEEEQT